jgi:hypothetical protein
MTPLEFVVCVTAIGALAADRNKDLGTPQWRQAIGHNICAAANAQRVDPRAIAAVVLNENAGFRLGLHMPAARGVDIGICQANSHYQRHRPNIGVAMHPYACAEIAAQVLRENAERYGWTWRAIAAYWSPRQAQAGTQEARNYYERWRRNHAVVDGYFRRAHQHVLATQGILAAGAAVNQED